MIRTRKMLVLSNGHLTRKTRDLLEESAHPDALPAWGATTPHGWLFWCDQENGSGDIPQDLFTCMTHARSLGCEYVLFDADGPDCEGLPWYGEEDEDQPEPAMAAT